MHTVMPGTILRDASILPVYTSVPSAVLQVTCEMEYSNYAQTSLSLLVHACLHKKAHLLLYSTTVMDL